MLIFLNELSLIYNLLQLKHRAHRVPQVLWIIELQFELHIEKLTPVSSFMQPHLHVSIEVERLDLDEGLGAAITSTSVSESCSKKSFFLLSWRDLVSFRCWDPKAFTTLDTFCFFLGSLSVIVSVLSYAAKVFMSFFVIWFLWILLSFLMIVWVSFDLLFLFIFFLIGISLSAIISSFSEASFPSLTTCSAYLKFLLNVLCATQLLRELKLL